LVIRPSRRKPRHDQVRDEDHRHRPRPLPPALRGAGEDAHRRAPDAGVLQRRARHRPPKQKTAKIVVVVPAHNEENSIAHTIQALLQQTRRPDRVVVVADNCTDKTVEVARRFGNRVTVIETVGNRDRKVGALTLAWQQYVAYGYDYMLGVDADTVLSQNALEDLERELETSPKVGGVMARYTFDPDLGQTRWARLRIRLQRMEFAAWTIDMLHRRRNTYVLGGQATLFRVRALSEVVAAERRLGPWDPEAQVEDMELTWALTACNWETKVSSTARAYAGPMITVKSLWAQRRKWDEGMTRHVARRRGVRVELGVDDPAGPRRAAEPQARAEDPRPHEGGPRPGGHARRRRALPLVPCVRVGGLVGDGHRRHPPRRLGPSVQGRGPAGRADHDRFGGGDLMRHTLNHLLAAPLDIAWKVLTVLTAVAVLDMSRSLLRRVRHIFP
jgi:hypothetical protein